MVRNTIFSDPVSGGICGTTVSSDGYNVEDSNSCGLRGSWA